MQMLLLMCGMWQVAFEREVTTVSSWDFDITDII